MNCPDCQGQTTTTRNGTVSGQWQRKCLDCGHEFDTVEVYAHQHPGHVMRQHVREILRRDNGGER